jgi:DNA-binding transcriptional ArsR family regulator
LPNVPYFQYIQWMTPDYDLEPSVLASTPQQLRALAHPLRKVILDLVLDRAATVTELAQALERPKSSVSHHVDTLVEAGLLAVVRTRRVRAIDERFYGRTGRTIVVGDASLPEGTDRQNFLAEALGEIAGTPSPDLRATLRHARIPAERADEFFARVVELAEDFTRLTREGDVVFGFVGAVYATAHPVLPEPT